MQICFQIQRQKTGDLPRIETYTLEAKANTTILDCLNQIKWEQDGSLAFRKNCRNTICGSCAIHINDRPALACKQTLQNELDLLSRAAQSAVSPKMEKTLPKITLAPLQNFPVIKDLVVEMGAFWQNLAQVDPYVSTAARTISEHEFLQMPSERAALNQVGNCIMCGACYAACNAKTVAPEFVGPHALAKAYRILADSREMAGSERMAQYTQDLSGVWGCTRCFNCNSVCPMDVAPLDQITQIKARRLAQPSHRDTSVLESRALRHRRTMVDLVAQGGWIDERRFGLRVVGNSFRDLKGLWSLFPLGLQMVVHRKFPVSFEASEGTQPVRALIHSIKMWESSMKPLPVTSPSHSPNPSNAAPDLTLPPSDPKLGWTVYAEQINGRFAMIGFILLLLLEGITHQSFWAWLGLR